MTIQFNDEFVVRADPDTVMRHFADIERVATCVPGASVSDIDEDGYWRGEMVVAFGPKKITFRGRVKCELSAETRSGVLVGGGTGAAGSANVKMQTRFSVTPERDDGSELPLSKVSVVSEAEVSGILAGFARTGGLALGRQLLRDFAANFEKEFGANPQPRTDERASLSALGLAVRTVFGNKKTS